MAGLRWVRVVGDGLAYQGPCVLMQIVMWPDQDGDYADLYDGRDATSGKKFARIEAAGQTTGHVGLGPGVPLDVGLYIDGESSAVETTVVFEPL